jgi:hypothetical protein
VRLANTVRCRWAGKKRFFLEKTAKTFATSDARRLSAAYLNKQEFFGSFFQKRTACG